MFLLNKIKGERSLRQLIFPGLIVIGGLIVLGASFFAGYFLSSRDNDDKPALTQPKSAASGQTTDIPRTEETRIKATAAEKNDDKTQEPIKLTWPANGEVQAGLGFSYSETYGDFRYHAGIDIIMPPGTPVQATAAGTCRLDSGKSAPGETLIITHDGGLETHYRGITIEEGLNGRQVSPGEVVGMIGESPADEETMAPHLHFAVYRNGQVVDPMTLLGGISPGGGS